MNYQDNVYTAIATLCITQKELCKEAGFSEQTMTTSMKSNTEPSGAVYFKTKAAAEKIAKSKGIEYSWERNLVGRKQNGR